MDGPDRDRGEGARASRTRGRCSPGPRPAARSAIGRDEGLTKLLFEPGDAAVLGAGIVGVNAGELIAETVLALEMGADAEDLALTIHPHPTLSETIVFAAEMAEGTITDLLPEALGEEVGARAGRVSARPLGLFDRDDVQVLMSGAAASRSRATSPRAAGICPLRCA